MVVDQVTQPDHARQCDRERFARFFHGMLQRGIYLPPAPFEAMFVSLAHSTADLNKTIAAFDEWADSDCWLTVYNLRVKNLAQCRKLGAAPIAAKTAKLPYFAERAYI